MGSVKVVINALKIKAIQDVGRGPSRFPHEDAGDLPQRGSQKKCLSARRWPLTCTFSHMKDRSQVHIAEFSS